MCILSLNPVKRVSISTTARRARLCKVIKPKSVFFLGVAPARLGRRQQTPAFLFSFPVLATSLAIE
jgi:hypothetical protein